MEERLENNQSVLFTYIDMVMSLRNMNYTNLSEGSGINYQVLANIKHGSQRLTLDRLQAIFNALSVNYRDYLEYIKFLQESGLHSAIALP